MSEDRYDVQATDTEGRDRSERWVFAPSVENLVREYRYRGVQVSEMRRRGGRGLFEPRGCGGEAFAIFNAELGAACRRGVPLPGALRALSREIGTRRMRRAIEEVAGRVEAGKDLASALSADPYVFPAGYVALVRAGLAAGDLPGALLLFSGQARLNARVARNTRAALAYPLAALFICSLLLALLGWVLVPFYVEMYREMDIWLPGMTWFLFHVLAPVWRWAPLVFVGVALGVTVVWRALSTTRRGRRFQARFLLSLPVIGRFCRAAALARFCRTFESALRAGVPVPDALSLASLASGNGLAQRAAERARRSVEEGTPVSDALRAAGFFPETLAWMIAMGEQRGELAEALEECARMQEERAERVGAFVPTLSVTAVTIFTGMMVSLSALFFFQAVMLPLAPM